MKGNLVRIVSGIVTGVVVALVFCYFFFYVDPSVICYRQQPLFLTDKFFLYAYLDVPGGMAEYLSLFISQFFFSKLAGAILLTLTAALLVFLIHLLLRRFFPHNTTFFLQFLPVFLFIYLHSHYAYDLRADMTLIFTFIFAGSYQRMLFRPALVRILFLVLSNVFLFWFFGSLAFFVFSILVLVSEVFFKTGRLFWIPSLFQLAVCIFMVLAMVFSVHGIAGMAGLPGMRSPDHNPIVRINLWIFYGIIPFLLLFPFVIRYVPGGQDFIRRFSETMRPGIKYSLLGLLTVLIPCLTYVVCRISFDRRARDSIQIHALATKGQWNRVLETANGLSLADRKTIFQINRALYHLNRLPDEAFCYPQVWGEKGLVLTANYSTDVLMLCSDLYFDMGYIKGSLHWAYEAQTKQEQSPLVLKRIALCNLIVGEYKAAEKFFRILSQSPVYRKWALHYLDCMKDETRIENDPLVQEKRKLLPRKDFYANTENPQYDLYRLFSEHPGNKMAFEYFMVYSMLVHDLTGVVRNIHYLDSLHYRKIPVHLEEALLLFKALNENYPVDLGRYRISRMVQKRFADYSAIMAKYNKDMKAARSDLYNEFGNTYWFYIHYVSPITTKRKIYEKTP